MDAGASCFVSIAVLLVAQSLSSKLCMPVHQLVMVIVRDQWFFKWHSLCHLSCACWLHHLVMVMFRDLLFFERQYLFVVKLCDVVGRRVTLCVWRRPRVFVVTVTTRVNLVHVVWFMSRGFTDGKTSVVKLCFMLVRRHDFRCEIQKA